MILSLITARASNGVIGNKGNLPWHIPKDLAYFKRLTTNHIVIMGRKTFDSIGILPHRTNIVVSNSLSMDDTEDLYVRGSLFSALVLAQCKIDNLGMKEEVFVIGGASLYKQAVYVAERLYITEIHAEYAGDSYFPEIPHFFTLSTSNSDDPNVSYSVYERNFKQ